MVRVAVVHDYFTQHGGAENVAGELYNLVPHADMFATVALDKYVPASIPREKLQTSWMQNLPHIAELYRLYFPLYPLGVQSLDLSRYDLVISSSSGYGKGVRTRSDALHVCYCHTPMRWIWRYHDYVSREKLAVSKRLLLPVALKGLKAWDIDAARQPDQYVANSRVVAQRIRDCYGREAIVIPPPIDAGRFVLQAQQDDYYLVLARFVSYKRIDLAVSACNTLGRRLFVLGGGPESDKLRALAGPTVTVLGHVSDDEATRYASECRALLFPGEEDFGMAPLELAAAGRPTIAYRAGGALETIVEGTTGIFFDQQDVSSLAEAILRFETMSWDPNTLRAHALRFDVSQFRRKFYTLLDSLGFPIGAEVADSSRRTAPFRPVRPEDSHAVNR
jgi:glycosyltransferase involved in cell wall biosynthesis